MLSTDNHDTSCFKLVLKTYWIYQFFLYQYAGIHNSSFRRRHSIPLTPVMVGNQKRQLQSLLLVQPWIAKAGVVGRQVILVEVLTPTQALRDSIARELQVNTTEVAALLLVDAQRLLQLAEDVAEGASLDAAADALRVAVHGVALPDHCTGILAVLDRTDMRWKKLADQGSAVASDERDLALFPGRVQGAEEGQDVGHRRRRSYLDANGVRNTSEELDVGVVDLAGAITDPEEVSRRVVVLLCVGRGRRMQGVVQETG